MQVLDSVLLVDDDEVANFYNKTLIKKLGIAREIVETTSGGAAVAYIEDSYRSNRSLPSLMLVDLSMPGMDGVELIRELRHSNLLSVNKIPLAVVTSSNADKDRKAVRELGNFRYITKPLDEEKVLNILKYEVLPTLISLEKKRYINERHRELILRMNYLKEQHQYLQEKKEEIKKFTEEVREKIQKFKKD